MRQIEAYASCMNACSACSGDYEDPEWASPKDEVAAEAEDGDSVDTAPPSVAREEFPVREE
jgi:hypothetical protein